MTTLAFVRSLIRWQSAMGAATALKPPIALMSIVDLEDAAVRREAALEWVAALRLVERNMAETISEAEARGVGDEDVNICNVRAILLCVRRAIVFAEEHVASFSSRPIVRESR